MTRARFVLGDMAPAPLAAPPLDGTDSAVAQSCESAFGQNSGGLTLRQRFDQVRRAVISAPRDASALREEITAMRDKVRKAHPVRSAPAPTPASAWPNAAGAAGAATSPPVAMFDVKHSAGGMVDAEFAVQYLVLAQSGQHPGLADNVGNIALLQRAERAGLLPPGIGERAASAYRELRRVQHHARLNEAPTQVPLPELKQEREAIEALWAAAFQGRG